MESKARKGAAIAIGIAITFLVIWLVAGNPPGSPAPGTPDAGRIAPKPGPVAVAPGSDDLTCRPPPDMETPPAPVAPPSFAGTVVDDLTGTPLPDVEVDVSGPRPAMPTRQKGKTDAQGRFEFRSLATGIYAIRAFPTESQVELDYFRADLDEVPTGTRDIVIRLARGRSITGNVRDDQGKPVAAKVEIDFVHGSSSQVQRSNASAHSDPDGSFVLHGVSEGTWDLIAEPAAEDDYVTVTTHGVAAGTTGLAIVLVRGAPIRGRLLAADGGDPGELLNGAIYITQQGADVRRRQPGDMRTKSVAELHAQMNPRANRLADGTFKTPTLPLGTTWDLVADGFPGFVPVRVPGIPAGAKDVEIRLDAGGSVAGTVLGPDGKPVGAGIPVWADVAEGIISNMEGKSATSYTKADGTFLLSGLGDYQFRLGAGGLGTDYAPTLATDVVQPGAKDATIAVKACAVYSGRLVDRKGEPMAKVAISAVMRGRGTTPFIFKRADGGTVGSPATCSMADTDADGQFVLRGLGEGEFWIVARDGPMRACQFEKLTAPAADALLTWKDP